MISGALPTRRTRRFWRRSSNEAGKKNDRGRNAWAVASARRPIFTRADISPHCPARRGGRRRATAAFAAGVPPGRSCLVPPRACESHGAAGDSSAGMASRAGLRHLRPAAPRPPLPRLWLGPRRRPARGAVGRKPVGPATTDVTRSRSRPRGADSGDTLRGAQAPPCGYATQPRRGRP